MVKLVDIARKVGLDVSVVSRTLNPGVSPHPVKKETRELILAAAEKMGYRPNRQAAFLKKGSAATLMCFVPDIGYRLIADLVFGISEEAAAANYPVNFFFGRTLEDFCRFYQTLREVPHAAAICYAPPGSSPAFSGSASELPVLNALCRRELLEYYNRRQTLLLLNLESNLNLAGDEELGQIPRIEIDEESGGRQVALHFLECGCQRFFYGTGHQSYPLRLDGYTAVLRERGIPVQALNGKMLGELRDASCRTGIFMDTDLRAFNFLGYLKREHLTPGRELLLSGYDDIFPSREIVPSLTTIHPPTREEGRLAVRAIQRCIGGEKIGTIRLEPQLVVRETTGGAVHSEDELPWLPEEEI